MSKERPARDYYFDIRHSLFDILLFVFLASRPGHYRSSITVPRQPSCVFSIFNRWYVTALTSV